MSKHLAIFTGNSAEDILQGKKTIEIRFSKAKIAPYGMVSVGDLVYIKPSGNEIIGQFRVKKVIFYDGLTPADILDIEIRFGQDIMADQTYWSDRSNSTYATIIFIGECNRFLTSPIKIPKKDLRGWVVLG